MAIVVSLCKEDDVETLKSYYENRQYTDIKSFSGADLKVLNHLEGDLEESGQILFHFPDSTHAVIASKNNS